jgi:hypothetical protein
MLRKLPPVLVLTVLAGTSLAACGGLPQPTIGDPLGNGDSSTQTATAKPPKPVISGGSTSSGYSTVPVFGQTEKSSSSNSNLVIVVGGASKSAGDVGTDGSFCVDVALKQGSNKLTFITQRENGDVSDPTNLTVKYDPTLADDSADTSQTHTGSVKDQAQNKKPSSTETGSNTAALTDGSDSSVCIFDDSDWSYPIIYLDLGTVFSVQRIEVQFSDDATTSGAYADEYDVITSVDASAQEPTSGASTGGWSQASSVSGASGGNGDGGLDTFTYGTPISARWVGIAIYSNNTSWYSVDYSIQIASIRVFAPDIFTSGGTNFGPPTCDSITQ